ARSNKALATTAGLAVASNFTFHVEENGDRPDLLVGSVNSGDCGGGAGAQVYNSFSIPRDRFSLDSRTGQIRTLAALDREAQASYSFDFICGSQVGHVTVLIDDKNDCAPTFSNSSLWLRLLETVAVPTELSLGFVEDADSAENGLDRVEITAGNAEHRFRLRLRQQPARPARSDLLLELLAPLDFESAAEHRLRLVATDKRGLTGSAGVTVIVENANDERPVFEQTRYSLDVLENATVGSRLLQVRATDRDAGVFGIVSYSIEHGVSESSRLFSVEPDTGIVRLAGQLDFETKRAHSLVLLASDGANSNSANLLVRVLDVNDRPPSISATRLGSADLTQVTPVGQPVFRVQAADPDRPGEPVKLTLACQLAGGAAQCPEYFRLAPLDVNLYVLQREQRLRHGVDDFRLPALPLRCGRMVDKRLHRRLCETVIALIVAFAATSSKVAAAILSVAGTKLIAAVVVFEVRLVSVEYLRGMSESCTPCSAASGDVVHYPSLDRRKLQRQQSRCTAVSPSPASAEGGRIRLLQWPYAVRLIRSLLTELRPPKLTVNPRELADAAAISCLHVVLGQSRFDGTKYDLGDGSTCAGVELQNTMHQCFLTVLITGLSVSTGVGIVAFSFSDDTTELSERGLESTADRDLTTACCKSGVRQTSAVLNRVFLLRSGDRLQLNGVSALKASTEELPSSGGSRKCASPAAAQRRKSHRLGDDAASLMPSLVASRLSPGQFTLSLTATDSAAPPLSASLLLNLTVQLRNERAPVFARPAYQAAVTAASTSDGTGARRLLQVSAVDPDGDPVTYAILSGGGGALEIDSATGWVSLADGAGGSWLLCGSLSVLLGATDCGRPPLTGNATLTVTVSSSAAFPPRFHRPVFTAAVSLASLTDGACVARVSAFDPDCGSVLNFDFAVNPTASWYGREFESAFRLEPRTGQLCVLNGTAAGRLMARAGGRLDLSVRVTDPSGMQSFALLILRLPSNGLATESASAGHGFFPIDKLQVDVSEWQPPGREIFTVAAVGGCPSGYRLLEPRPPFQLLPNGSLLLQPPGLDFETGPRTRDLRVSCDGIASSSVLLVSIGLLNENDNPPDCGRPASAAAASGQSVPDNLRPGDRIDSLACEDPDGGPVGLTYELAGPAAERLSLAPSTGLLTVRRSISDLAGSGIDLSVRVCDSDLLCSNFTRRLLVRDTNDHRPALSQPAGYWFLVSEAAPVGSVVGRVAASDPDLGDNGRVRFRFTTPSDYFGIDAVDGAVRVLQPLDREAQPEHLLTVEAADAGTPKSLSAIAPLSVLVSDVNDAAPTFGQPAYRLLAAGHSPLGAALATVSATDADAPESGGGGNGDTRFAVSGPAAAFLTVHPVTGVVSVAGQLADLDSGGVSGQLTATDGGGLTGSSSISLQTVPFDNVDADNDNVGGDDRSDGWRNSSVSLAVSESASVGHVIGRIFTESQAAAYFTVVRPADSAVAVAIDNGRVLVNRRLDRESAPVHAYQVLVTEAAQRGPGRPRSCWVALEVRVLDENDNWPVFADAAPAVTVPESLPAGSPLYRFFAADPDTGPNGTVRFRLAFDRLADFLWLHPVSGQLYTKRSLVSMATANNSFEVAAVATDLCAGPPDCRRRRHAVLRVQLVRDVNNWAPQFRLGEGAFFLPSDPAGRIVGHLELADPDPGPAGLAARLSTAAPPGQEVAQLAARSRSARVSRLQQSAADRFGLPSGLFDDLFLVDSATGQVRLSRTLHPDSRDFYSVTALLREPDGQLADTCLITVSLQDENLHSPEFAELEYFTEVPEGQAFADLITVTAHDPDRGPAGRLVYSIDGDDALSRFILDPSSGRLSCSALDYPRPPRGPASPRYHHRIRVVATDGGGRTGTALVLVRVLPANRFAPVFRESRYSARLPELAPPGHLLLAVSAWDREDGDRLAYRVVSQSGGAAAGLFSVHPATGELRLAIPVDREKLAFVSITVAATDSSEVNPMSALVSVDVEIVDQNDHRPEFASAFYSARPAGPGPLLTLRATDRDSSAANSRLTYSLAEPDSASHAVTVDPDSGLVSLGQSALPNSRLIRVRASDSGLPAALTAETAILLLPATSKPALLFDRNFTGSIAENSAAGTCLTAAGTAQCLMVTARVEGGDAEDVLYDIVGGNEDGLFCINSESGRISVAAGSARPDFETRQRHLLVVAARLVSRQEAALATVQVRVLNVDDCAPVFAQRELSAVLEEKAPVGAPVARASAADCDSPVKYRLAGPASDTFAVDEDSGQVLVKSPPDYSHRSRHNVTVLAVSVHNPLQTDRCFLTVRIVNKNNQKPLLQPLPPVHLATAVAQPGSLLAQLRATDLDGYPPISYSVHALPWQQQHRLPVAIGLFTGQLWLTDRPAPGCYLLQVTASDSLHSVSQNLSVIVEPPAGWLRFSRPLFAFSVPASGEAAASSQPIGRLEFDGGAGGGGSGLRIVGTDRDADEARRLFRLDEHGGVYLRQPISRRGDHVFAVRAGPDTADSAASDFATVRVTAVSINRRPPTLRLLPAGEQLDSSSSPWQLAVPEDAKPGSRVGRLVCSDPESGPLVSISLVAMATPADSGPPPLAVVAHTGQLVLNRPLDRELAASWRLTAVCEDSGQPRLTASAELTFVKLTSSPGFVEFRSPCAMARNLHFLRRSGRFRALVIRGSETRCGNIASGAIGPLLTCCDLRLEVADVNDNAPEFDPHHPSIVSLPGPASAWIGRSIPGIRLVARDADSVTNGNGRVSYSVAASPESSLLARVDPDGNLILLAEPPASGSLELLIVASDSPAASSAGPLSACTLVTLQFPTPTVPRQPVTVPLVLRVREGLGPGAL
uniref:Cadherin domain-containing protein n=2 Tax=Macrostomum lignano TaxID=282301 RepID=A0A1I8ICE3_9PLAT